MEAACGQVSVRVCEMKRKMRRQTAKLVVSKRLIVRECKSLIVLGAGLPELKHTGPDRAYSRPNQRSSSSRQAPEDSDVKNQCLRRPHAYALHDDSFIPQL